jgi:fibronectin type 3 domain-containing protein
LTQGFGNIIYDSPSQSVGVVLSNVPATINNFTINSTGSASLILGANINPSMNLTINGGTFDMSTYTTTGGSNFYLGSGAKLRIGGYDNFPGTFAAYTIENSSIVEYYYGPPKNIAGRVYGNLRVIGPAQSNGSITVKDSMIVSGGEYNLYGYPLLIDHTAVLKINPGGSIAGNSPTYGVNSYLLYAVNGLHSRGSEWTSTTGPGLPYHIRLSNNTSLNLGANGGNTTPKGVAGNLTIDDDGFLDMSETGNEMTAPLIVQGSLYLYGYLYLSPNPGGDVEVGGDWVRGPSSWFTQYVGNLTFNGSGVQTIDASQIGDEESFERMSIDKPSGTLNVTCDLIVDGNTDTVFKILDAGSMTLAAGKIFTFNNSGGLIYVEGGARSILGNADIFVNGSKTVAGSGGGSLVFGDSITLNLLDSFDFGSGISTVNGTLKLVSVSTIVSQPPIYGPSSLLYYFNGATVGRGSEWSSTSGAGYPHDVRIGNSTTLNLGYGGTNVARQISGDLTIDNGSTLRMNQSGYVMTQPLTVAGNITVNGWLIGSGSTGNSIYVGGDLYQGPSTAFHVNGGAVHFIGSGDQKITSLNFGQMDFYGLVINKPSGNVVLDDVNGTRIVLDSTLAMISGNLDLKDRSMQLQYSYNEIVVDGGVRTITGLPGSYVNITGDHRTVTSDNSGSLVFDPDVIVGINTDSVYFGSATTIKGTLLLESSNAIAAGGAPVYDIGSMLAYDIDGLYNRGDEWSTTTGAGYPYRVEILGSTELNLGFNAAGTPKQIAGSLYIESGSMLNMNFSGHQMTAPFTVIDSAIIDGMIELSGLDGGDLKIGNDLIVTNTTDFYHNNRSVWFIGSSEQTVTETSNDSLRLGGMRIENSSGGVVLNSHVVLSDTLRLMGENLITGTDTLTILSSGVVVQSSGSVAGNLRKEIPAGTNINASFEVGTASSYTPVGMTFNQIVTGGMYTVSAKETGPSLTGSLLDTAKHLPIYWRLENEGVNFDTYDVTFNFNEGDVPLGADQSFFIVGRYDGASWFHPDVGTRTSTSTQTTGINSAGIFTLGEPVTKEILSTATSGGSISPSGSTLVILNGNQQYSITPDPGYYIKDVLVEWASVGPVKTYDYFNVTDTSSIHAVFEPIPASVLGEYGSDPNTVVLLRFNESAGDVVYDYSGNDNVGIAYGPTIQSGRIGNARYFDGTDQYVQIDDNDSFNPLNTFTVEAWINIPSKTSALSRTILGKGISNANPGITLEVLPGGQVQFTMKNDSTSSPSITSDSALVPNRWNHIAVIYDGAQLAVYINGELRGTTGTTIYVAAMNEKLYVGKKLPGSPDEYFVGSIDEIRISDIARNPSEFNLRRTPQNLSYFPSGQDINLMWNASEGTSPFHQYLVYRGPDSTILTLHDSTTYTFYADTSLPYFSTYHYSVTAADSAGFESDPTPVLPTFVPDYDSPEAPILLSAVGGDGTITVTWSPSPSTDVKKYWILIDGGFYLDSTNSRTDTTLILTGKTNSTAYGIAVMAFDSVGNQSNQSNQIVVTPNAPVFGEYVTDEMTVLLLHLDETDGNKASDVSGYNNFGYYSSILNVPGKFGNAQKVIDQNVVVGHDTTLEVTNGSFTIEAWVYVNNVTLPFDLFNKVDDGRGYFMEMVQNAGTLRINIKDNMSNEVNLIGTRSIADGNWHHVAMMFDEPEQKLCLYIDGVEDTSTTTSVLTSSFDPGADLRIGPYVEGGAIIADQPRGRVAKKGSAAHGMAEFDNILAVDEFRISTILRSPSEFNLQLPPVDLAANPAGTTVNLEWQNGGGMVPMMYYKVYRGADSTSTTVIDSTSNLLYANTGLPVGEIFFYRVSTVDSTGFESPKSYAVSASTVDIDPPSAPTALTVIDSLQSSFTLQWNGSIADDFRAYLIFGGTHPEVLTLIDSTTNIADTTKFIPDLTIGTQYIFFVTAVDTNDNESGNTNFVYATPYMIYPASPFVFGSGTIDPDTMVYVDHGDSVTFTVRANAFHHIDSVVIDAVYLLIDEATDDNVRENRRIITKRPAKKQPPGAQLLTSFPAFIGGNVEDTLFVYTFSNVMSAHTISAFFSANPNIDPYFTSTLPDTAIARFDTLTYGYFAADPEGAEITYTLLDGPIGASIDPLNGLLTYIPAPAANGAYMLIVEIADDSTTVQDTAFVKVNIYGDVSGNGTISAFDASKILRHVVGIDSLDPLQQRIGDVSGNLAISSLDASYILQYTVGLIGSFPGGLGKVTQPEAILSAFSFRIDKGTEPDQYDLFVTVNKPSNVYGAALSLSYDTMIVSPVSMRSTALTDSMMIATHFPDRKAHLALAGTQPMNDAGDIVKFTFVLKDRNYPKNAVLFTMDRFVLNETDHTNDVGGISLNVRGLAQLPAVFALSQNFPNPFNPATTINYDLPEASNVRVAIYNILGQAVKTLVNENQLAGYYSVQWNGTGDDHRSVASGMYLYRIEAVGANKTKFTQVKKMMMLK